MRGGWDSTQFSFWSANMSSTITSQSIGKSFVKRSPRDYTRLERARLEVIVTSTDWRPKIDVGNGLITWHPSSPCGVINDNVRWGPGGGGGGDARAWAIA